MAKANFSRLNLEKMKAGKKKGVGKRGEERLSQKICATNLIIWRGCVVLRHEIGLFGAPVGQWNWLWTGEDDNEGS